MSAIILAVSLASLVYFVACWAFPRSTWRRGLL